MSAATMKELYSSTSGRLTTQRDRVATHWAPQPEIPGEYGCAGECTTPPPAFPLESFTDPGASPRNPWLLLIAVAGAAFLGVTLLGRR